MDFKLISVEELSLLLDEEMEVPTRKPNYFNIPAEEPKHVSNSGDWNFSTASEIALSLQEKPNHAWGSYGAKPPYLSYLSKFRTTKDSNIKIFVSYGTEISWESEAVIQKHEPRMLTSFWRRPGKSRLLETLGDAHVKTLALVDVPWRAWVPFTGSVSMTIRSPRIGYSLRSSGWDLRRGSLHRCTKVRFPRQDGLDLMNIKLRRDFKNSEMIWPDYSI